MKHQWTNIREELKFLYREYDSFSTYRLVVDEADRLNQTYFNNFFGLNRGPHEKRMQLTEDAVNSEFSVRYDLANLSRKSCGLDTPDDGWPHARVLFGERTNEAYPPLSDKDTTIGDKNPLHLTVEYCERATSLRFARTFFLNTLSEENYMDACTKFEPSKEGSIKQKDAKTLFHCYATLIRTYDIVHQSLMRKEVTPEQVQSGEAGYDTLMDVLKQQLTVSNKAFPDGADHFNIEIKQYDSFGDHVSRQHVDPKCLVVLRMQIKDIHSEVTGANLGSVLYAQSLLWIEAKTYITVTKNVPNMQFWMTSQTLYKNIPVDGKNNGFSLGDALPDVTEGLIGVLPCSEQFADILHDTVLNGSLQFYQHGFCFTDSRLGPFVVLYEDVKNVTFFLNDGTDWMQVELTAKGADKMAGRLISQDKIILKVRHSFFRQKFKHLESVLDKAEEARKKSSDANKIIFALEKVYGPCPATEGNFALTNLEHNKKVYNAVHGSEYASTEWDQELNREILEFHAI